MTRNSSRAVLALIMAISIIATAIFGFFLLIDGEAMFVIGTVISMAFLMFSVNGFVAFEFSDVAEDKGYTGAKYFWYAFLLGCIGYLLVIALPDRGKISD